MKTLPWFVDDNDCNFGGENGIYYYKWKVNINNGKLIIGLGNIDIQLRILVSASGKNNNDNINVTNNNDGLFLIKNKLANPCLADVSTRITMVVEEDY